MMMAQPRRRPRAAIFGAALFGAVATICHPSVGFLVAPNQALGLGLQQEVAALAGQEAPACRDEVASRVAMYGRYPDRTGNNNGNRGRLAIRVNRKPCLAYAVGAKPVTATQRPEPGGAVLGRMWRMYDADYNKMIALRDRYHWGTRGTKNFMFDYKCRSQRRKNLNRIKRETDETWTNWMATAGKDAGLQEPIIYKGPTVPFTEEEFSFFSPESIAKNKPPEKPFYEMQTERRKRKWDNPVFQQMKPGCWPEDTGPSNIFNLYARPLKKHPYDIPDARTGRMTRRGNVF